MTAAHSPIAPGATLGIIGGGQLGRMSALAAARLGYRAHVFTPEADGPAAQVCAAATIAAYDDREALAAFADAVDVVTFEFENIPADSLELLAARVPVRPGPPVLAITQHRGHEKDFVNRAGVATAPYALVDGPDALATALGEIGWPAVLKTTRFGYDGKGQILIGQDTDPADAWAALGGDEAILEGFVDFVCEMSVVVARGPDGATATFDPVENIHEHHILARTLAPARRSQAVLDQAREIARRLAKAIDLVGLLAVEMFLTPDDRLLVNELAPRPHNSGHWTLDACMTSQFEQHVRAVCGLPLGSPARLANAEMRNLLGRDIDRWPELLADPTAKLHLYGKAEARFGRKMGHVTRLLPRD